jgi:saccharopine dehydrogenase (NAD+, L-lysine-forming)
MSGRVLLYGATGYTGEQLAEALAEDGCDLVLAGRNAAKLAPLAERLGLPWRAFPLNDPAAIDAALSDIAVVVHAAGPFVETAAPMMAACLRAHVHYLDLCGEWPVFADAQALSPAAAEAGVMLMPGVGFTVAASDCLMALAKAQAPEAVRLRLGISKPGVITRGTVISSAGLAGPSALVRKGGMVCSAPAGRLTHDFDFGDGLKSATLVSWPDVVTGEATTGIPDIEVYSEADWTTRLAYRLYGEVSGWANTRLRQGAAQAYALAWPETPSAATRERAGFVLVCEALDRWRRPTRLRLRTRDGYTVSLFTTREIVRRVLAGDASPGFRTPAGQFGGELILGLGCAALEPS